MFNQQQDGRWSMVQTITPSGCAVQHLNSLMVVGKQLVVRSTCGDLFVYQQELNGTTWMNETKIHHRGDTYGRPGVAIQNDIVVAASYEYNGALVYKREGDEWREYAVLKCERTSQYDWFQDVRIRQNLVFTSRYNSVKAGYTGAVFVHDLAT